MNLLLGILVGTILLWLLNSFVVVPITKRLTLGRIAALYSITEEQTQEVVNKIFVKTYILVDTLILGIAGFAMGFFIGWYFIGITWKGVAIPGMLAFIGLSILGYLLNKGYI